MTHYPKTLDELTTIYQQIAKKQGDSFDYFSNVCYGGYPITHSKEIDLPINKGVTFSCGLLRMVPLWSPILCGLFLVMGTLSRSS